MQYCKTAKYSQNLLKVTSSNNKKYTNRNITLTCITREQEKTKSERKVKNDPAHFRHYSPSNDLIALSLELRQ